MSAWTFAVVEVSRAVARHTRRSASIEHNWILFAAGAAIVLIWSLLIVRERRRNRLRQELNHAIGLFNELCGAHRLSAPERTLLLQVVQEKQLGQPALVFLDPALLRASAQPSADACARDLLAAKLFGSGAAPAD